MRSYTRDGIECPVGVHYLGSLDQGQVLRKIFDYLGFSATIPVSRMGENGIIDRYLFDVGVWSGEERVRAAPFEAVELNLARLWPAPR